MNTTAASSQLLDGPSPADSMSTIAHTDTKSEKRLSEKPSKDIENARITSSVVEGSDGEQREESAPDVDPSKVFRRGEGESALPEDKRIEALERIERDWAHDPINPRNWPFWRKWRVAGVVRPSR